jgi:hypothetical protein
MVMIIARTPSLKASSRVVVIYEMKLRLISAASFVNLAALKGYSYLMYLS